MGRVIKGRLDKQTQQGPIAIFDATGMSEAQTNDLLDNPDAYADKTYFHSKRHYPSFVNKVNVHVTLPTVPVATGHAATYNLFQHNMGEHPYCQGRILNYLGNNISLNGSVPIEGDAHGFARWLALGSDATNIMLHEKSLARYTQNKPAITIELELMISDLTVQNYNGSSPGGPHFRATKNHLSMGDGKFDSDKRYITADDSSNPPHRLVGGVTCKLGKTPGNSLQTLGLKYNNGGYSYQKTQVEHPSLNAQNVSFIVNSRGVRI